VEPQKQNGDEKRNIVQLKMSISLNGNAEIDLQTMKSNGQFWTLCWH